MQLFKFKIILISLFATTALLATQPFTDQACFKSSFDISVKHKGSPFGWTDTILKMDKKGCVITVMHQRLKFLKQKWIVDVCRGPVHIKQGTGSVDVIKRDRDCSNQKKKNEFCHNFGKMEKVILDDGLIFAEGDKEVLDSDHGKVYCAYMLIRAYLGKGLMFSGYHNYSKVLDWNVFGNPAVNVAEEKEETVEESVTEPVKEEVMPISTPTPQPTFTPVVTPTPKISSPEEATGSF